MNKITKVEPVAKSAKPDVRKDDSLHYEQNTCKNDKNDDSKNCEDFKSFLDESMKKYL